MLLMHPLSAFPAHQSGWTIPDHMLRVPKRVIKDDLLRTVPTLHEAVSI